MATIDVLNNPLFSFTGSGAYAGSIGPSFTGNIDASGASEVVIPSSSSPSLAITGQIAVDTSITGYPGLLQYYSGSEILIGLGMLESDLVATNNYAVKYNSASSKFVMAAQAGGSAGKLSQYVIASSTSNDTTTATSPQDTSLTGSITPLSATSTILILCYGYVTAAQTGPSATQNRDPLYDLRRTTGTPISIQSYSVGRELIASSSVPATSYCQMCVTGQEVSGSTSLHTYLLRYNNPVSSMTTSLRGDISVSKMIIMEFAP